MKHLLYIFPLLYFGNIQAQEIYTTLRNPSFEGIIQEAPPPDWYNCMYSPDTGPYFPGGGGAFDGNNYIGFASNDFFWEEFVSQRLDRPLVAGQNYFFNIYLAADSVPVTNRYGKISIWLGDSLCEQKQKIFTSPILNETWSNYLVSFQADSSYNTIQIGAQPRNMGGYFSYSRADLISPIYTGYPTSISQPSTRQDDIAVFPNPSEGIYTLAYPSALAVQVLDLAGRVLVVYPPTTTRLDLTALPAGVYVLSIGEDKQKLIKL